MGCTIGTSDAPPDGIPDFAMLSQLLRCACAAYTRFRRPARQPSSLHRRYSSHQTDDDPFGARPVNRLATRWPGRSDAEVDDGTVTHATSATLMTLKPTIGLDPVLARVWRLPAKYTGRRSLLLSEGGPQKREKKGKFKPPPPPPTKNAYVERFIGSARRGYPDHVWFTA